MTNLHKHYEQLSDTEKLFVDQQFEQIFSAARAGNLSLDGDDKAERAVDALAQLVIESRPTPRTCNRTHFVAGGRIKRVCGEPAEAVCVNCSAARCAEHDDLDMEEVDGKMLCENCR